MNSCTGRFPLVTTKSGYPSPFTSAHAAPFVQWPQVPTGIDVDSPADAVTSWKTGTITDGATTLNLNGWLEYVLSPNSTRALIWNEPRSLNHCAGVTLPPTATDAEGGITTVLRWNAVWCASGVGAPREKETIATTGT